MKIEKIWKGFEADHSSTNYHFYSSRRKLTEKERNYVNTFSSRANTSKRSVTFQYYGDFADLPNRAQDELINKYFDVMVKESYDWWELVITIPFDDALFDCLKDYDCNDENDLGITISKDTNQIFVSIFCVLDYENIYYLSSDNVESNSKEFWGPRISSREPSPFTVFANLLISLKIEILNRSFSTLQSIANHFDPENFNKPDDNACTDLNNWFVSVLGRI